MKNIILSLFIISFACSCTQIEKSTENNQLYNQYKYFISLLNNENYSDASNLISERNIRDLTTNSNRQQFASYFPALSSLNDVFKNETDHFEKRNGNIACLTVVGYDSSNEKTAVNIKYLDEENSWKIDFVHLSYLDIADTLPTEATCPTRMQ